MSCEEFGFGGSGGASGEDPERAGAPGRSRGVAMCVKALRCLATMLAPENEFVFIGDENFVPKLASSTHRFASYQKS